MIDVCFNLSVVGNLNAIKYKLGNPIRTDNIVQLDLQLNYGLLNGDLFETQSEREAKIHKSFFTNFSKKELSSLCKKKMKSIKTALVKLDKMLNNGEEVRLWLSNNAFDRCGLYWFCDYVRKYECKVYTIICPGIELVENENKFIENTRWAAFSNLPYMASFSQKAIELSKAEIIIYSELWQRLITLTFIRCPYPPDIVTVLPAIQGCISQAICPLKSKTETYSGTAWKPGVLSFAVFIRCLNIGQTARCGKSSIRGTWKNEKHRKRTP